MVQPQTQPRNYRADYQHSVKLDFIYALEDFVKGTWRRQNYLSQQSPHYNSALAHVRGYVTNPELYLDLNQLRIYLHMMRRYKGTTTGISGLGIDLYFDPKIKAAIADRELDNAIHKLINEHKLKTEPKPASAHPASGKHGTRGTGSADSSRGGEVVCREAATVGE